MNMDFLSVIDQKKNMLTGIADQLWEAPETAFAEFHSVKLLCDALRAEGFQVTENLADIPTAFSGRFGSGKPVIGFLGELLFRPLLQQMNGCRCSGRRQRSTHPPVIHRQDPGCKSAG